MDTDTQDLDKIKKVLHSLEPYDYIQFMREVHFECPFKTKSLTDVIVNHWINDHSMKTEEFDKIIKDREAEHKQKAQQKLKEDLHRIQDMKSRTGLDPLRLFPKEIWMMVIDQVPPQDKLNIRNVHDLFNTLTETNLIRDILLPMMVGFQVERFWDKPAHPLRQWVDETIPLKPLLSPMAQYTELRLVSKSMRNAVDRWFEDDIISELHNCSKTASPSVVISIDLHDRDNCHKFANMKRHLNTSPKFRRFFTRSLQIVTPKNGMFFNLPRLGEPVVLEEFPGNIDDILDQIGDQIWYFSFEFIHPSCISRNDPKFYERYTTFLGWLGKMPQLKWLKVTINQSEKDSRRGFRLPEGTPPALSYLKRLDLDLKQKNRYILPVCNKLLAAYSHVKMLNLQGLKSILKKKIGFVASESEPAKIPLSLETLILDGTTTDYPSYAWNDRDDGSYEDDKFEYDPEDENFDDAALFQSIIQSNWPLKEIDWNMKMWHAYVDGIFHLLGGVKTLEKIKLAFDDVVIRDNSTFLELPNLKHFEFNLKKSVSPHGDDDKKPSWSFLFSLQFLLFAKKLKTLIWKCEMEKSGWEKVQNDLYGICELGDSLDFDWVALKLLGFTDDYDIEESNIWRAFRQLDTVVLGLSVRKRDDVEKSVEKKYLRRETEFKEKTSECDSSSSNLESEGEEEEES